VYLMVVKRGGGRLSKRRLLSPVSLVILVALSACSPGPGTELEDVGWPYPVTGAHLVIEGLPPETASRDELVEWAEDLLAGQCMAAGGFKYFVTWRPSEPTSADEPPKWWSFGNANVGLARAHGYRVTEVGGVDRLRESNAQYVTHLSMARQADYKLAYSGDPHKAITVKLPSGFQFSVSKTGCLSTARTWLYGDLAQWLVTTMTVSNFDSEVHPAVVADPRYIAALGKWRDCLQSQGYHYSDPMAARKAGLDFGPADRQQEINLAVSDAECTVSSRLLEVVEDVYGQKLAATKESRQAYLVEYDRLQGNAAAKARKVLAVMRGLLQKR
jgi:hypothetical protein